MGLLRAAHPLPVLSILPLCLALALPHGVSPSVTSEASIERSVKDPLDALRSWIARAKRQRRDLDTALLRELIDEVDAWEPTSSEREREIGLTLLDVGAIGWLPRGERPRPGEAAEDGSIRPAVSRMGLRELDARLRRRSGEELAVFFADEVLAQPKEHGLQRRLVAADALHGKHVKGTMRGLIVASHDEDRTLQRTALSAIAGWPSDAAHLFFLEELERGGAPSSIARTHFEQAKDSIGPLAMDRLSLTVGRMLLSEDWRRATQARGFVRLLDAHRIVPILIEALATWTRRAESGTGSKRIQHEIVSELQRISGRSIGLKPERWNVWWNAVLDGRVKLPEQDAEGVESYTSATFFGLRPVTDKVVFVVDRSGSMDARFGTSGRTRYEEAVDQLLRFLTQSGPETRFGIVLFNDQESRWTTKLNQATKGRLQSARAWLRGKGPKGGTELRRGVNEAVRMKRNGKVDLRRLEADTIIVLCDGETSEGPQWVLPMLDEMNEEAQLLFHCVQIGSAGDGTLQALARGSGGDFVRVDG